MTQSPAGWHPDPTVPGQQRYWDGQQWTASVAPLAVPPAYAQPQYSAPQFQQKPKKPFWQRWWFITICVLVILGAIGAAGVGASDDGSSGGSNSPSDSGATLNDDGTLPTAAPGATLNADSGHDNVIEKGASYTLGDFEIEQGWRVKWDKYLGWSVKDLVVRNATAESLAFFVQIKVFADDALTRVLGNLTCTTGSDVGPGEIVDVTCLPNGHVFTGFPHITIAKSF